MFSHSDLLGHSCKHCFREWTIVCDSTRPLSTVASDGESKAGCLWHILAKACSELCNTSFQMRSARACFGKTGYFVVDHKKKGDENWGLKNHFEILLKSSDQPNTFTTFLKDREMTLIPGSTSSDATFDTIRVWMSSCETNHSSCGSDSARRTEKLSGIRFLHIRHDSIQLDEDIEPDRYACLSHCWGSGKELSKTTVHNRSDHIVVGILIKNLPKTYQDAVLVCNRLGIGHLWIDSLCIVQEDEEDWRKQAARMADVYENAYVTIAAVGAQNASQGLFNATSTSRKGAPLPGFPWIHIQEDLHLPDSAIKEFRTAMDDGWALYKRGWTFQELTLSPRVLHFCTKEVLWSCREKTTCEGDPKVNFELPALVSVSLSATYSSAQQLWYKIIKGYSWRNLTFEKDKLPAVAAFASRLQQGDTENQYVAGLWKNTLLFDLLWYCDGDISGEPTHPIQPGIRPSWSWASSKRPVDWPNLESDTSQHIPCTTAIRTTYDTRGSHILGDIIEASLEFRAPMIRLSYKTYHPELRTCWESQGEIEDSRLVLYLCEWDHLERSQGPGPDDDAPSEVLAVPLIAHKSGEILNIFRRNALLLTEDGPGTYRRAGIGGLGILEDVYKASSMVRQTEGEEHERRRMNNRYIKTMCRLERQEFKLV